MNILTSTGPSNHGRRGHPYPAAAAAAVNTNYSVPRQDPSATTQQQQHQQQRFNIILSSRQEGVRPTGERLSKFAFMLGWVELI